MLRANLWQIAPQYKGEGAERSNSELGEGMMGRRFPTPIVMIERMGLWHSGPDKPA